MLAHMARLDDRAKEEKLKQVGRCGEVINGLFTLKHGLCLSLHKGGHR